jgi:hypothetical protein
MRIKVVYTNHAWRFSLQDSNPHKEEGRRMVWVGVEKFKRIEKREFFFFFFFFFLQMSGLVIALQLG